MVWYSYLFQNFPQFVVTYTVKAFHIVNEADVLLEFPCFLYDPVNAGNLISGSFVFSKPSLYIWQFMYCWSLACRILNITLLAWEMIAIVLWLEHSLVLPFLEIGIRIDLFQSCGHCCAFQICWHTECSTLIASSFRILNSSAGIPSPPLVLLAAVLSKAPLTSHSRMSGSEWETTSLWLYRLLRYFLYNLSVF